MSMDEAIRDSIAAQASTAIADRNWEQLRYIGNRFERARCYGEAWEVLATSVEARSAYSLPLWNGPK